MKKLQEASLQAQHESTYRLLIDESVPAAILLSCQMQCTVPVSTGVQCEKCRSSIRSEVGGTLKLGSVLGRQKYHFSDEIEKQSIM